MPTDSLGCTVVCRYPGRRTIAERFPHARGGFLSREVAASEARRMAAEHPDLTVSVREYSRLRSGVVVTGEFVYSRKRGVVVSLRVSK